MSAKCIKFLPPANVPDALAVLAVVDGYDVRKSLMRMGYELSTNNIIGIEKKAWIKRLPVSSCINEENKLKRDLGIETTTYDQ